MLRLLIILSCNVVGVFSFANRSGILRGCEKWPHQQHAPLPPLSLSNGEDAAINSKPKRPKEAWVLVVEDEDDLRCAIGTFLSKRGGYHVTGVSDARSAIILCRGMVLPDSSRGRLVLNSDTNATYTETCGPDCLVLDVRLGSKSEMDGLELLKKIRCDPVLEGLPVVLLTAKGNIEDRINGYKAGADAYLPKPFSPEELLVIVNGFMQMKNKLPAKRMDVRSSNTAKNGISYSELKTELKEIKSLINQLGLPERQPDSSGRDKNAARSLYSELVGLKEDVKQIIDARSDSAS